MFSWCPACGGCALKSDVTPLPVIPCLLVCSQKRWDYILRLEAVPLSWWEILRDRPCPRESQKGGLGKEMFLLGFRTLAVSLAIPLGQGTLTNILRVFESEARIPV